MKGLNYLIDATATIVEKRNDVLLVLVGGGPEKNALNSQISKLNLGNYVLLTGEKPHGDIPIWLAASDVFAFPSLTEGFPTVILEAMASGLPIVATNITGLPEIIEDGKNGLLVEPKNPQLLGEAILKILNDVELGKKMSRSNLEDVRQYSWQNFSKRLDGVFREVIHSTV